MDHETIVKHSENLEENEAIGSAVGIVGMKGEDVKGDGVVLGDAGVLGAVRVNC